MHLFVDGELANWFLIARAGSSVLWMVLLHIAINVHYLRHHPNEFRIFIERAKDQSISKRLVLAVTGPIPLSYILYKNIEHVEITYAPYVMYDFTKTHHQGKHHYANQNYMEYIK